MRLDSHQHFWELGRFPYAWMPSEPSPLRRNFLPEDLQPILKSNRFDGCITVQAATVPEEAEWLFIHASEYSFIQGVVAWADLTDPRLGDRLDVLQRHPKFKGIRHPVHDEPDENWLMRPEVLRGLAELERRGIPYDLLLRPPHLKLMPLLTDKLPRLRMVIDHLAKPRIAERLLDGWTQDIARAAESPNVFVKISGMITEADWAHWKSEDLRPYVHHVLACFGPNRCMFGSDWPVCLLAGRWKQVLAAFTQAHGPLSVETRSQLLGETAMRFYNIAGSAQQTGTSL